MNPPKNGRNLEGFVYIPNPTVMTIAMVRDIYPPPIPATNLLLFFLSFSFLASNQNQTNILPLPLPQGNVTLDLYANGQFMGHSYINDLTLQPGDNNRSMTAQINQTASFLLISGSSAPYPKGVVPFTITGNSSVYNGQELPYFTQALAANNLTVDLDVYKIITGKSKE